MRSLDFSIMWIMLLLCCRVERGLRSGSTSPPWTGGIRSPPPSAVTTRLRSPPKTWTQRSENRFRWAYLCLLALTFLCRYAPFIWVFLFLAFSCHQWLAKINGIFSKSNQSIIRKFVTMCSLYSNIPRININWLIISDNAQLIIQTKNKLYLELNEIWSIQSNKQK